MTKVLKILIEVNTFPSSRSSIIFHFSCLDLIHSSWRHIISFQYLLQRSIIYGPVNILLMISVSIFFQSQHLAQVFNALARIPRHLTRFSWWSSSQYFSLSSSNLCCGRLWQLWKDFGRLWNCGRLWKLWKFHLLRQAMFSKR